MKDQGQVRLYQHHSDAIRDDPTPKGFFPNLTMSGSRCELGAWHKHVRSSAGDRRYSNAAYGRIALDLSVHLLRVCSRHLGRRSARHLFSQLLHLRR
jgi:hypothetical protein